MSHVHFLPVALLAGVAVLLVSAHNDAACRNPLRPEVAPPPPDSLPPPRDRPPDPEATAVLDRAVAQLDPRRLAWVETDLRQEVTAQGLTYIAEGHYLSAPGSRW